MIVTLDSLASSAKSTSMNAQVLLVRQACVLIILTGTFAIVRKTGSKVPIAMLISMSASLRVLVGLENVRTAPGVSFVTAIGVSLAVGVRSILMNVFITSVMKDKEVALMGMASIEWLGKLTEIYSKCPVFGPHSSIKT